jgi:hypothetical protein
MCAQLKIEIANWAKAVGPDVFNLFFFRIVHRQHTTLDFLFWHARRKENCCIRKHPKGPMQVVPFQFMGDVMKSLRSNDVRVGERYVAGLGTMSGKKEIC